MLALFCRYRGFSDAQPLSAQLIGQGSAFLYRQGVLCVQKRNFVVVTNLRSGAPVVHIDLTKVVIDVKAQRRSETFEILYYSDGILAVRAVNRIVRRNRSLVLFVSTSSQMDDHERLISYYVFDSPTSELFVRHNAEYVCLGTHTALGEDGHRKWLIKIRTYGQSDEEVEEIVLEDFHGNDIGSTVAFDVHDGYLYAVSNQSTFEAEEIDWTSFYHCVRIPLSDATEEAVQRDKRVYRRQHADGAIHDSWTDLTLQHDERTNDLYIVEGRREWIGASSRQARNFYTTRMSFSEPNFTETVLDVHTRDDIIAAPPPLPDNDVLTKVLDPCHSANYMPTPKQYSWTRHCELSHSSHELPATNSFILARTKFRSYNFSSSTFVDLVEDGVCCSSAQSAAPPCLRLRHGSRRIAPAGYESHCYEAGNPAAGYAIASDPQYNSQVPFEDDTQYRYTPIRMWPPPLTGCPCSIRLHRILNPTDHLSVGWLGQRAITAVSDERSIVYMIKSGHPYRHPSIEADKSNPALGWVVLIDFGHSPTSTSSRRWSWDPSSAERCRQGTCQ